MEFIGALRWEPVVEELTRTHARVCAPFGGIDSKGRFWGVPEDFISDGASFPSWLIWVPTIIGLVLTGLLDLTPLQTFLWISFLQIFIGGALNATYMEAAVLHDVAYRDQGRSRWLSDLMFFEAICAKARLLREKGKCFAAVITYMRAPVMWAGVRAGGWEPWRKNRRKRVEEWEGWRDSGSE